MEQFAECEPRQGRQCGEIYVPTVANGKVYIGTRGSDDTVGGGTTFGEVDVYGLMP